MLNLRRTNTIDSSTPAPKSPKPTINTTDDDTVSELTTQEPLNTPTTPIKRIFKIRRTRTFDAHAIRKPPLDCSSPCASLSPKPNDDTSMDRSIPSTRPPIQPIKRLLTGLRRTTSMDASTNKIPTPNNTIREVQPELEWLAEDLQKELIDQKLVQDHPVHRGMKTIHKSFSGKELIDTLHQLMLESRVEESTNATREDALEKGNAMISQLSFFKHATNTNKPLLDTPTEYYQFHHNLPSQVQRAKNQHKSPWDKVRLIEKHVEVKDRRHLVFRGYPDCFVACEAVDVMMELKLAVTRKHAVQLMKYLNQKVFCCEHVDQEHEFKDEYLYFSFIPPHERMPESCVINDRIVMGGGSHRHGGSTRCSGSGSSGSQRSKSPKRRHKPRRARSKDETGHFERSSNNKSEQSQ